LASSVNRYRFTNFRLLGLNPKTQKRQRRLHGKAVKTAQEAAEPPQGNHKGKNRARALKAATEAHRAIYDKLTPGEIWAR